MVEVDITTKHLELPTSVDKLIRKRVQRLERFYPRLQRCSVLVKAPEQHYASGGLYKVHIDMQVPGAEQLTVSRQSDKDLLVAVRESFDAARRQLDDFARLRRGQVKSHQPVARKFVAQQYI